MQSVNLFLRPATSSFTDGPLSPAAIAAQRLRLVVLTASLPPGRPHAPRLGWAPSCIPRSSCSKIQQRESHWVAALRLEDRATRTKAFARKVL